MYKTFPKVSEVVSKDKLRPSMTYAVVHNKNLVATDAHILIMLKVSSLVNTQEQENNLDGKVFSKDLLLILQKAKRLIFLSDKISVDGVMMDYSGTINADKDVFLGDSKDVEFRYPNYEAIMPNNTTELESINLDPKNLVRILDCFSSLSVSMKFHGKTRAIIVSNPLDANQMAICMPTQNPY